jgi:hypothetical protein
LLLVTVAELLLKLPLMHPQQLRKKAQQPLSPGSIDRPSSRPTSYLKTRIRGSRLQNAANILALVELTRRLHQAYAQAYDKQTADRLLPQNPSTFPGGTPNPIAQLGPCPELVVPAFGQINQAAATLLQNTYGSGAEAAYGRMSTYEKAVFLNTAGAAASVGVNVSGASFDGFLTSNKPGNLPYGFYISGITGVTSGRHRGNGSVEIEKEAGRTHIDVDLFNPLGGPILFFKHQGEIKFNDEHNRPTHPGDVVRQLQKGNKVNTGVSCKP